MITFHITSKCTATGGNQAVKSQVRLRKSVHFRVSSMGLWITDSSLLCWPAQSAIPPRLAWHQGLTNHQTDMNVDF
jgi:hypothetical protein